ncbi:hypothetical protein GTW51_14760 [Aurantimonas aggregata]|uniref:DUF2380 domain-containing protein n=1 Tax=Aurantimonas aggregata TaxID=2047720 RepID=A0A6L9MJA4_9HYPH|nr:hypothetical protein [Aurantimonas aggregata]NDV87964.1 hypothetical protein [Aurantimonas aggregata]
MSGLISRIVKCPARAVLIGLFAGVLPQAAHAETQSTVRSNIEDAVLGIAELSPEGSEDLSVVECPSSLRCNAVVDGARLRARGWNLEVIPTTQVRSEYQAACAGALSGLAGTELQVAVAAVSRGFEEAARRGGGTAKLEIAGTEMKISPSGPRWPECEFWRRKPNIGESRSGHSPTTAQ